MRRLLALLVVASVAAFLFVPRGDESARRSVGTHVVMTPPESTPRERADESEIEASSEVVTTSRDPVPERNVRLTVTVLAAGSRAPIAGADVYVQQSYKAGVFRSGRTDAAGVVTLDAPRTRGVLVVRSTGRLTYWKDLVDNVDEARRDVELVAGTPLHGRVVRAPDGEPVEGAEVYAWDASTEREIDFDPAFRDDWSEDVGVRTTADGSFAFAAAPTETDVVVAARAPGLATVSRRIVAGTAFSDVIFELGRGASIAGVVRDTQGAPVEGAEVYAVPRGDEFLLRIPDARGLTSRATAVWLSPRVISDVQGRYRIDGLPTPAGYVVTVARRTWDRGHSEPVELRSVDASATRDVVVIEDASIRGKLIGPDGAPVDFDGFRILTPDGQDYVDPFANGSSASGDTFRSTKVVPGEYLVEVRTKAPYPPVRERVVVAGGGATEVTFRFAPGATLTGFVTEAGGAPAEGVTVRASGHRADAAADGSFRVDGVATTSVDVLIDDRRGRYVPQLLEGVRATDGPLRVTLTRGPEFVFKFDETATSFDNVSCDGRTIARTFSYSLRTEADGRFHLRGIEPGERFDVTIRVHGHMAPMIRRGLVGQAGESVDLGVLELRPARTIRGVVLCPDGSPASGARVEMIDRGIGRDVIADASGAFEIHGAPHDELLVAVEVENVARTFRRLRGADSHEIRLDEGVEVIGRVLDANGGPACGVGVIVRMPGDAGALPSSPDWSRTTDSLGEFRARLPAGTFAPFAWRGWRFDATPLTDGNQRPAQFEVKGTGPVRVELRLR